jgi:Domain of unknown function (DUF4276)
LYGIIAEDDSDAKVVSVLIRSLIGNPRYPVLHFGYCGGGDLLKNGYQQLRAFRDQGCDRFVVCHDADGPDYSIKYTEVMQKVIVRSGIDKGFCVVIPVQELEAWILADIEAVSNVITGWRPLPINGNPEGITNPKERLLRESRKNNKKPRYDTGTHNPQVAKYLRVNQVRQRCPSFERLAFFVTGIARTPGQQV